MSLCASAPKGARRASPRTPPERAGRRLLILQLHVLNLENAASRRRCSGMYVLPASFSQIGVAFAASSVRAQLKESPMKKPPEVLTRDNLLGILNEEELVRVRKTGTAAQLINSGDEYIDLNKIDLGVLRAGESHRMEDVLSRRAVHENTWRKVVTDLLARQAMAHVPSRLWKKH